MGRETLNHAESQTFSHSEIEKEKLDEMEQGPGPSHDAHSTEGGMLTTRSKASSSRTVISEF